MDNLRLRAIIIKLQDRLSDDDRRRLHFFFGNDVPRRIRDDPTLGGTLCLMESLFDQDKINEQDFTFLIEAFEQIKCTDAARLLREYTKQRRSNDTNASLQSLAIMLPEKSIPCQPEEIEVAEEDKFLLSKEITRNSERTINDCTDIDGIENDQTTKDEYPSITSLEKPTKHSTSFFASMSICRNFSNLRVHLIWIVLLSVLLGVALSAFVLQSAQYKSTMRKNEKNYLEQLKNQSETIHQLEATIVKNNDTIYKLYEEIAAKGNAVLAQEHWREGKTCSCDDWCRGRGQKYGVCGDGLTCICRDEPITKVTSAEGCSCDSWCRVRGHSNGGVCGDGYTCICS